MDITTNDPRPGTETFDWLVDHLAGELAPESRVPLYEQLMHALRKLIDRRMLPPDKPLPPEPELASRLGISRQTVNQALTTLARQGLLVRRRGIGTFVAAPTIEQPLDGLYSFIRTLASQGRKPSSRILGTRITVDDAASPFLTGQSNGLVFELTRIRLVDDDPLVFEEVYLPVECGELIPHARFATDVLYDLLRELCAIEVNHADETMQPVVIGKAASALLGAGIGEPAFLVERQTYAGNRPVELRRSLIRGDRYRFRIHLAGNTLLPEEDGMSTSGRNPS
jgi:GntR family transcriptional regulator